MPAFHYSRAARVLAEADLFGDASARSKWQIKRSTFYEWRSRLQTDQKLRNLFESEKAALISSWQGDAIRVIRVALQKLEALIHSLPDDGDHKKVLALANTLSKIGELTLANRILEEEEELDDED